MQKMVFLIKGDKALDVLSFRPICPLDTMGKILEEILLQRFQEILVGDKELSNTPFDFGKDRERKHLYRCARV